jgi:hypothetical protein
MADIVCVEPGVDHERSVVEVSGSDTLVFPHVDSCMSVTLFVPSSTLIGGHAGMMDTTTYEMNASGLLDAMIQRMLRHGRDAKDRSRGVCRQRQPKCRWRRGLAGRHADRETAADGGQPAFAVPVGQFMGDGEGYRRLL